MNHNFNLGLINFCQICNSDKLIEVFDFGFQPLADDLQLINSRDRKYVSYPLIINLCKDCMILQNKYIVGDKILYPNNYHYLAIETLNYGYFINCTNRINKISKHVINNYILML